MHAGIVLPIVGIKKGVELIPDDVPPFRIKVHNDLRQRDFQLCRVVKKSWILGSRGLGDCSRVRLSRRQRARDSGNLVRAIQLGVRAIVADWANMIQL